MLYYQIDENYAKERREMILRALEVDRLDQELHPRRPNQLLAGLRRLATATGQKWLGQPLARKAAIRSR